jgi:hypothetical protein
VPDRQSQEYRQPMICLILVLAGAHDSDVFISIIPVFRKGDCEPVDSFGNDNKVKIRAQFYHRPDFLPPFIGFFDEEIRCHAGIDRLTVRLQLIHAVAVLFQRETEIGGSGNNAGVFAEFCIPAINIAVLTTG